jgi:uncharacterized membrane protein (DUF2068 family)
VAEATSGRAPADPGIRAIAIFEAAKGAAVLLVGLGALSWHHGLERLAVSAIRHLHLNPARHAPHVLDLLAQDASAHAMLLAAGAGVYVAGRFAEAAGLWLGKQWAVWLAVVTAAIYLPFELAEAVRRPGVAAFAALIVNLGIVLFLLRRTRGWRAHP